MTTPPRHGYTYWRDKADNHYLKTQEFYKVQLRVPCPTLSRAHRSSVRHTAGLNHQTRKSRQTHQSSTHRPRRCRTRCRAVHKMTKMTNTSRHDPTQQPHHHFQEFIDLDTLENFTLDLTGQHYDQCWFTVTCNDDNPTNITLTGYGILTGCNFYDLANKPLEQLHAMHAINPNPQAWNPP